MKRTIVIIFCLVSFPAQAFTLSCEQVREYVAKYGGSASGVNADVAEAYSVGQITADAVKATGSTKGSAIDAYLHGDHTFASVEGPVQFNSVGENVKAIAFVFQWQNGKFVQVLPIGAKGSVPILYPKPNF